jgi:hypothetical protein
LFIMRLVSCKSLITISVNRTRPSCCCCRTCA